MDFTPQEYPHLYNRMNKLAKKAQQKREDRQIREEFGDVDYNEEEYIYNLERVKSASGETC